MTRDDDGRASGGQEVSVLFVCWGNICRSPMAERVARGWAEREGVAGVRFTSGGVSDEEEGNPIDRRAQALLVEHGYDASGHRAHRVTAGELREADLVVAAEPEHLERMRRMAPDANLRLLTDFDPDAEPGSGIPDPWFGGAEGFEDTLASVEGALPGVLAEVERLRR